YVKKLNSKNINLKATINENQIDDWLQVIGTQDGKSIILDPRDIPVQINSDDLNDLNQCKNSYDDTRTTHQWLTEVLDRNDIHMGSAGDQLAGSNDITGSVVLYYTPQDQKTQKLNKINIKPEQQFVELTKDGVNRLKFQDDVFSFRFQGSLIEDINIEKISQDSKQTIRATQAIVNEYGQDPNDIKKQSSSNNSQTTNRQSKIVTIQDKKNVLQNIFGQLLGLTVKCIAHPWLQILKEIAVKGTGYFDGKYIVSKIKHSWDNDNR